MAAEDTAKSSKGRPPKIVSVLTEKAKQTGGKLTWGDLDEIFQKFGLENDTDEIEEILSICEREGIAITDEEAPLEDMSDAVDADLAAEGTALEQDEALVAAVESTEAPADDAETPKPTSMTPCACI